MLSTAVGLLFVVQGSRSRATHSTGVEALIEGSVVGGCSVTIVVLSLVRWQMLAAIPTRAIGGASARITLLGCFYCPERRRLSHDGLDDLLGPVRMQDRFQSAL